MDANLGVLAWIVITRFRSGDINAVDFTVYFDRPIYQTAHGRLLFVETADLADFSHRSQFAVHAYYNLLLVAPLSLLIYAAHVVKLNLYANAAPWLGHVLDYIDYMTMTFFPYVLPVLLALALYPDLRKRVLAIS